MESNAAITIMNLNRTDDGLYECVAENDGNYFNMIIQSFLKYLFLYNIY